MGLGAEPMYGNGPGSGASGMGLPKSAFPWERKAQGQSILGEGY